MELTESVVKTKLEQNRLEIDALLVRIADTEKGLKDCLTQDTRDIGLRLLAYMRELLRERTDYRTTLQEALAEISD